MQIPLNVQWDEVNLLLAFASSAANCPFCFLETRWLGLHQAAERGPKPVSNHQAKERKSIQLKRFRLSMNILFFATCYLVNLPVVDVDLSFRWCLSPVIKDVGATCQRNSPPLRWRTLGGTGDFQQQLPAGLFGHRKRRPGQNLVVNGGDRFPKMVILWCSKMQWSCRCHWNILQAQWKLFEELLLQSSTLFLLINEILKFFFLGHDLKLYVETGRFLFECLELDYLRFKPRRPGRHHVRITSLGGRDRSVPWRKLNQEQQRMQQDVEILWDLDDLLGVFSMAPGWSETCEV